MEVLKSNLGWIILLIFVLTVFLYKTITKNKDALTSKFTARQVLPLNINVSLQISKLALQNAKFRKIGIDLNESRLHAHSAFSMSSWSEMIQVKATEIEGGTEIKFKSICSVPTQIYDWGKNRRNYIRFQQELSKLTSSTSFQ